MANPDRVASCPHPPSPPPAPRGSSAPSWPADPAYRALADALRLAVADGRIPAGTRLPSERELTAALDVSRTTVTRAYAVLRDSGYLTSRRGSGSVATLPSGSRQRSVGSLFPADAGEGVIDLTCAATRAPAGVVEAYERRGRPAAPLPHRRRLPHPRRARAARRDRRPVHRARPADQRRPGARHLRSGRRHRRRAARARRPRRPGRRREPGLPEHRSTPPGGAGPGWCRSPSTPTAGTSRSRPARCARRPPRPRC